MLAMWSGAKFFTKAHFENYLKYNVIEAISKLNTLPGESTAELVNFLHNTLNKINKNNFAVFAILHGARANAFTEEHDKMSLSFENLVAPTENRFDENKTREACHALIAFEGAATPVYWDADVDAAALFAIVLRGEAYPMAFMHLEKYPCVERGSHCVRDALCQIRKAAARNAPLCLFAERGVRSFEYARKRQRRN